MEFGEVVGGEGSHARRVDRAVRIYFFGREGEKIQPFLPSSSTCKYVLLNSVKGW